MELPYRYTAIALTVLPLLAVDTVQVVCQHESAIARYLLRTLASSRSLER
jgi:hypothetical protein